MLQFNDYDDRTVSANRQKKKYESRPGNCKIKLNQNPFLREIYETFVIEIYSDGVIEAKQTESSLNKDKFKTPTIQLMKVDEAYAMDCWVNTENGKRIL